MNTIKIDAKYTLVIGDKTFELTQEEINKLYIELKPYYTEKNYYPFKSSAITTNDIPWNVTTSKD